MRQLVLIPLLGLLAATLEVAHAAEIQLSGFGSFIGGIRSAENGDSYDNYGIETLDFKPDSLVGVQVSTEITDQASVTVQLLAKGVEGWSTDVNWAYVRYQPSNDFAWKLGRLGIPFYLYSDYLSVGYSFPWISPPYHAYHVPYSNIDGADFVYSLTFDNVDIELQGYVGTSSFTPISGIFVDMPTETRDQFGLVMELNWQSWKLRYGYHGSQLYVDTSATANGRLANDLANALEAEGDDKQAEKFRIEDDYTDFQGIAAQYDDGRYLVILEGMQISTHDDTPAPLDRAYYLTGGYRQGNFLYHLTYSVKDHIRPNLVDDLPTSSPSYALVKFIEEGVIEDESAWTLGLRWDFVDGLTFKTEMADVTDHRLRKLNHNDEGDIRLFRFGIQTVF